jgi:hypothetical protein
MPVYHSGQSRLLWHALFESGLRMGEIEQQHREITLISPWITDLTSSRSGWSYSAITSALGESAGGLESLSDVLISLAQKGYQVRVATLSTTGKWLRKKVNSKLDEEVRMMKKLSRNGVDCYLGENIHMKYLSTPFCVLSGSLNLSFNGIHGRNQENTHLTFEDNQDYPAILHGINRIIEQSRPYDEEGTGTLVDWETPDVELFVQELDEENIGEEENVMLPEFEDVIDEGGFSNYVPIEIVDGSYLQDTDLRKKYIQSKFIQILQQIGRIILLSTHQKVNEKRFKELEQSIVPNLDGEGIKEILPSIAGIKRAILSEDEVLSSNGINTELLRTLVGQLRSISRTILLSNEIDDRYFDLLREIESSMRICLRGF